MSKAQELLQRMADAWENNEYCSDYFLGAIHALEAIPECYHSDVLNALFKPTKQEEDEQPADYAVVKTFDSSEFHVGDEIEDEHGVKGLFTGHEDNELIGVIYAGGCVDHWNPKKWHRTGRNFPAIAAILDKIK